MERHDRGDRILPKEGMPNMRAQLVEAMVLEHLMENISQSPNRAKKKWVTHIPVFDRPCGVGWSRRKVDGQQKAAGAIERDRLR